jgi:hypothetical protein
MTFSDISYTSRLLEHINPDDRVRVQCQGVIVRIERRDGQVGVAVRFTVYRFGTHGQSGGPPGAGAAAGVTSRLQELTPHLLQGRLLQRDPGRRSCSGTQPRRPFMSSIGWCAFGKNAKQKEGETEGE